MITIAIFATKHAHADVSTIHLMFCHIAEFHFDGWLISIGGFAEK